MSRKNNPPLDRNNALDPFEDQNLHPIESDSLETEMETVDQLGLPATGTTFEHENGHHEAGKRDVELYIRTYNTLLRSSGEISLKALVQAHYNIDSSLHPEARSPYPDMSAFIYSVLRLPVSIIHCHLVLLGQSEKVFQQQGFHVDGWEAVTASARRRKWFYNGKETLAVYVASVSDTGFCGDYQGAARATPYTTRRLAAIGIDLG
ncbi:MAG: hypothetical protein NVS9B9_27530 [Ktedonobacteraceae bacterium]